MAASYGNAFVRIANGAIIALDDIKNAPRSLTYALLKYKNKSCYHQAVNFLFSLLKAIKHLIENIQLKFTREIIKLFEFYK